MTKRRNGFPKDTTKNRPRQVWMKANGSGKADSKGEKGAIPTRD